MHNCFDNRYLSRRVLVRGKQFHMDNVNSSVTETAVAAALSQPFFRITLQMTFNLKRLIIAVSR